MIGCHKVVVGHLARTTNRAVAFQVACMLRAFRLSLLFAVYCFIQYTLNY